MLVDIVPLVNGTTKTSSSHIHAIRFLPSVLAIHPQLFALLFFRLVKRSSCVVMCCTVPAASQRRETKSESLLSKVSIDDVNVNHSALMHDFIIYTFSSFFLPVLFPQIPAATGPSPDVILVQFQKVQLDLEFQQSHQPRCSQFSASPIIAKNCVWYWSKKWNNGWLVVWTQTTDVRLKIQKPEQKQFHQVESCGLMVWFYLSIMAWPTQRRKTQWLRTVWQKTWNSRRRGKRNSNKWQVLGGGSTRLSSCRFQKILLDSVRLSTMTQNGAANIPYDRQSLNFGFIESRFYWITIDSWSYDW